MKLHRVTDILGGLLGGGGGEKQCRDPSKLRLHLELKHESHRQGREDAVAARLVHPSPDLRHHPTPLLLLHLLLLLLQGQGTVTRLPYLYSNPHRVAADSRRWDLMDSRWLEEEVS